MSQSEPEVLTAAEGAVGHITLNRPRALNALTLGMCEAVTQALLSWRADAAVRAVLLDHAGERGFCAGGDVRAAARSAAADAALARRFFHTEYRLNDLMFAYPKPIVAVMDGVTMGGGVGVSAPAAVRVATERTLWAMPELAIGLFPDVGAGWHLSRLPGETGTWLALTGARLKAADLLALGLATHFVPSDAVAGFKACLLQTGDPARIDAFTADPGVAGVTARRADIDRLFAHDSVEAIIQALEAEGSVWAQAQLALMRPLSPLSSAVALRQLRQARARASFTEEMAVEYLLADRICRRHDFAEGVRAVLIDKDNAPRWDPPTLADVDPALLAGLFAPLPAAEAWTPLTP